MERQRFELGLGLGIVRYWGFQSVLFVLETTRYLLRRKTSDSSVVWSMRNDKHHRVNERPEGCVQ